MCPPSSGSIGRRLNIPTKIFRLATINTKVAKRSIGVSLSLPTASPETRATPTTPTNPLASRSSPRTVAPHSAGTFSGNFASDLTLSVKNPLVTIAEFLSETHSPERFKPTSLTIPRTYLFVPSISVNRPAAVIEISSPLRSRTSVSSFPFDWRITSTSLYQSVTFLPLMDRISSPGCIPAASAAESATTWLITGRT